MADVILIQPKVEENPQFYKNPIKKIKYSFYSTSNFIPLGLLHLSRYLVHRYKVKIIDQRIDKDWKKHLLKELNQNPICVAISFMTGPPIKYSLEISKFIRENSNVPIVWGGRHPSLLPKQTLENPNVDIIVKGEGEITFYELVKALEKNKTLKGIKGVWFKNKGIINSNEDREFLDMNNLPEIPYDLIDIKRYLSRFDKFISIETTRGCTLKCQFCIYTTTEEPYRSLEAKKIVEQIKYLNEKFKIKYFNFTDDNFFLNHRRSTNLWN